MGREPVCDVRTLAVLDPNTALSGAGAAASPPVRVVMLRWTCLRLLRASGMVISGVGLEGLPALLRNVHRDLTRLLKVQAMDGSTLVKLFVIAVSAWQ